NPESLGDPKSSETSELRDFLYDVNDRDDVKVVALLVAGSKNRAVVPAKDDGSRALSRVLSSTDGIWQLLSYSNKVTITGVCGDKIGPFGVLLALCSDLAFVSKTASLASPAHLREANYLLMALTVGLGRMKAWAVEGSDLSADEAVRIGVVSGLI